MTKTQFTLSSLVAAIPAGMLGYLMTMAFVNHFENMTTMAQLLAGLTLATCVVLVAVPVYVLFVWDPASVAAAPSAATAEPTSGRSGLAEEVEEDDGLFDDDADGESSEGWDDESGDWGEPEGSSSFEPDSGEWDAADSGEWDASESGEWDASEDWDDEEDDAR